MPIQDHIPAAVQVALADYRCITTVPVQWGDMDAFQHVNNVVYLRWFESARTDLLGLLQSAVTMSGSGLGPILVSIRCDYKKQLHYPDTVHIGSRVGKLGRSSVEVEHAVFSEQLGQMAGVGVSVLVVFDYDANRPVRIPEALRQQMGGG